MEPSGIKYEIHVIQNFAPSNLNRDDTGQPKSATFGGFRRARISSQCSKRSIRMALKETSPELTGERTKLLKSELMKNIKKEGTTEEANNKAVDSFITQFYSKMEGDKTSVLLFVSRAEIQKGIEIIDKYWDTFSTDKKIKSQDEKNIAAELNKAKTSADIALFGRMLAENPARNTDAACQVAHPISTHKVDMEMDYYTAVDDLNPEGETGAGMIGDVGYNSACFYRYALVDRDQLARNLARKTERRNGRWLEELDESDYAEADEITKHFLDAFIHAIPTGKQNSFAAHNLPSFGMLLKRHSGVPLSLANAFSKPVRPKKNDDDIVGLSIETLIKHWNALTAVYGEQSITCKSCFHVQQERRLEDLSDCFTGNVSEAIEQVFK